jgi:long-chain acyl-CoA synthetase
VPKGVVLTHGNIVSNALSAIKKYDLAADDVVLSYLPLAHMFERTCGYYTMVFTGGRIGYAENLTTVAEDAEEIRPTVVLAVPRVIEKVHDTAVRKVESRSAFMQHLVTFAVRNLNEYANLRYRNERIPLWLKLKCAISRARVASKFKKLGGGRIRLIVSGGAPLNRKIAKMFYILGFNIVEGYGLTETSPVVTCNGVEDNRLGTVGRPFEGVQVRIGEDDEILVKGPNVMKCYFKRSEETARVIDQDGWFHTGDQGRFDDAGNLIISGRIKELIVTSGGKKIIPSPIEARICMSPHIDQAMLCGDRRNYLVAILSLKRESIEQYAAKKSISSESYPSLLRTEEIRELIRDEIREATGELASYERVKAFALVDEEFSIENELLTATLKLRRGKVMDTYSNLIDAMYSGDRTPKEHGSIVFM